MGVISSERTRERTVRIKQGKGTRVADERLLLLHLILCNVLLVLIDKIVRALCGQIVPNFRDVKQTIRQFL